MGFMMNIQPATYIDLDLASDGDTADDVLADAREWVTTYCHVPAAEVEVTLVRWHGTAGGNPVVRFAAQDCWLAQIEAEYDAEAEG